SVGVSQRKEDFVGVVVSSVGVFAVRSRVACLPRKDKRVWIEGFPLSPRQNVDRYTSEGVTREVTCNRLSPDLAPERSRRPIVHYEVVVVQSSRRLKSHVVAVDDP